MIRELVKLSVVTGLPYRELTAVSDRVLTTYFDVVNEMNAKKG